MRRDYASAATPMIFRCRRFCIRLMHNITLRRAAPRAIFAAAFAALSFSHISLFDV
jgi:hypothetical protein